MLTLISTITLNTTAIYNGPTETSLYVRINFNFASKGEGNQQRCNIQEGSLFCQNVSL